MAVDTCLILLQAALEYLLLLARLVEIPARAKLSKPKGSYSNSLVTSEAVFCFKRWVESG